MKPVTAFATLLSSLCLAQAQVTLTSQDFLHPVGSYYRQYANPAPTLFGSTTVDVSGLLGTNGGPQTWDFTSGPTNVIYRHDIVNVSDSDVGSNFPQAKYAERQKNEANSSAQSWNFLELVPGVGRRMYGSYSPDSLGLLSTPTEIQFEPPFIDFPDPLTYQSTWTINSTAALSVEGMEVIENYTVNAVVDAYGTIILPGIGAGDCLRVNQLDRHVVDFGEFGAMTQYSRIYYFLRPGYGIVAEIHSKEADSAPGNNFTSASQFVRMFEFKRTTGNVIAGAVTDMSVNLVGNRQVLLTWSRPANINAFRVEYSTNLADPNAWKVLNANTTSTFYLDANQTDAMRFYRIVSLGQ